VKECPSAQGATVLCKIDSGTCKTGSFSAPYASFSLDTYCVPNDVVDINIESVFKPGAYEEWVYDLQTGWVVLLLAAVAAMILSLLFFVFVRCCTGPVIWLAIVLTILGLLILGVFFILQAKGVTVSSYISDRLSSYSYDTLITAGIILIVVGVMLTFLVICLRSRLNMGAKAV
jgi:hypothetical protein